MKINEVEQAVGITKKSIRYYEQEGLLKPSRNLSNGYRDYSQEDVETLLSIKLLRKLGIPIEDIKKLEAGYLTLEDCLRRHLIFLERESKNLTAVMAFCHRLLEEELSAKDPSFPEKRSALALNTLPAAQLLEEMKDLEEGGTRFMKEKNQKRHISKKNAWIAALTACCLMLMPLILVLWIAAVAQEAIPGPVILLVLLVPCFGITGTILALRERIKEIEGGELDEASKY